MRHEILYRNNIAMLNAMDRFIKAQKRAPSRNPGFRFSSVEPKAVYTKPSAVLRHHNDTVWWANTHISPVPTDISETIPQQRQNIQYVERDELLAWHLHDVVGNPVIANAPFSLETLPARTGPYADMLEDLHSHFLWNGGRLMEMISILTGQYWDHHLVIKKGAPRLRDLKTRVNHIPEIDWEYKVIKQVELLENNYMCDLYQRFDRARKLLTACEKIYRCVEQIFLTVVASDGDIQNMHLRRKLYVLIDWIRLMNTRRREPSGVEARATQNESLSWNYVSDSLIAALEQLKEYHDMRYGGVESILQFIN